MQLDFMLIADMANVDAAGKFNIIGEFNMIKAPALPTPEIPVTLVARVIASTPERQPAHTVAFALVDEDGRQIFRTPDGPLKFGIATPGTTGDLRAQIVLTIANLRLPRWETYSFHLLVDGRDLGHRQIHVVQPPNPPPASPPALPPAA